MDNIQKKKNSQSVGVTLDWKSAGYYPWWFLLVKIGFYLLFGASIISALLVFLTIFQEIFTQILFTVLIVLGCWWGFVESVNRITTRWVPINIPNVQSRPLAIRVGGDITLNGITLLPSHHSPPYPVAILAHGYNSRRGQLNYIASTLSQLGIAVLSFDLRGYGQTGGDKNDILFALRDLNTVLDYVIHKKEFDSTRIIVVGLSFGAIVAMYEGYLDPKVAHVIGLATTADYHHMITANIRRFSKKWFWKFTQRISGLEVNPTGLQNRLISPVLVANHRKTYFDVPIPWEVDNNHRILLIHCSDDYVVPPDNLTQNISAFGLNPENVLLLQRGSHWFIRQEIAVMGKIIGWLIARHFLDNK